jgi:hypothetical protein
MAIQLIHLQYKLIFKFIFLKKMQRKDKIYIAVIIILIIIILTIIAYQVYVRMSFSKSYINSEWADDKGDIIILQYKGQFSSDSSVGFYINKGNDEYDATEKKGNLFINPLSYLGYKYFTATFEDYKFKFNLIESTLNITKKNDDTDYGMFTRISSNSPYYLDSTEVADMK